MFYCYLFFLIVESVMMVYVIVMIGWVFGFGGNCVSKFVNDVQKVMDQIEDSNGI